MSQSPQRSGGSKPPQYRKGSKFYTILEEINAGDLFVGFLTSGKSFYRMRKTAFERARARYENKLALERMERCGFVKRKIDGQSVSFFITPEGKRALQRIYRETATLNNQPRHWDHRWRVVSYDFPEEKRSLRNSLRYVLEKCNYLQVQKSVWIFPYRAHVLEELLNKNPELKRHVLTMEVTQMADKSYREHFGLANVPSNV